MRVVLWSAPTAVVARQFEELNIVLQVDAHLVYGPSPLSSPHARVQVQETVMALLHV